MQHDVKVPSVGESISEGILSSWIVKDGEYVSKGETIFELESDKANSDVPAPESGILHHRVEEGEEVQIGAVVGMIDTDGAPSDGGGATKGDTSSGEDTPPPAEDSSPAPDTGRQPADAQDSGGDNGRRIHATSVARKIAEDKNLDLAQIEGTGNGGRITREDVEKAASARSAMQASSTSTDTIQRLPEPPPSSISPRAEATPTPPPQPASEERDRVPMPPREPAAGTAGEEVTREKMSMLRRRIAERLLHAKLSTAMLTTFNDVDMSAVMELRKQFKEPFKDKHGVGLGFMSFFVAASVNALRAFPRVNAMIDGNEVVQHHRQHIGVAVSTPKGLVVPVLKYADAMNFAEIESRILDFAKRARSGGIDLSEMQGGTFTITNGGVFGSMLSTPILNPPQSAILGMHRIEDRPVARDGQVVIRPMMYLALSYDHRIVDGKEAVSFLVRVKDMIENPARLLLDV